MGSPRRCETELEARGGAGGSGESAFNCGGVPRARASERGDNAENGSGNGNRDGGPVGALRGALANESEATGGEVD